MKNVLKVLFGFLFLASAGVAMADEDRRDDRDEHGGARVIVVPADHYYRHRRRHYRKPVVHNKVELKVGIGEDRHDDHDDHR